MNRYKITISNRNLYKEIELSPDMECLTIGTTVNDDVRIHKALLFENIKLTLKRVNLQWTVICSENIYLNFGDSRKLLNSKLENGMQFKVCYQESDNNIFDVVYAIDFDYEKKNYGRYIDLSSINILKIGSSNDCNIIINDEYMQDSLLTLEKKDGNWNIGEQNCLYGVFVNGQRIDKQATINNLDFFSIVGYSFFLKETKLFMSTSDRININGIADNKNNENTTIFAYPKFNKSTRIQYNIPAEEIEIQQPVNKPHLQKKSLLISLIPSLVMLAMTILLRGVIGGGGTFVIYSAVSMGMGAAMSVVTYVQDRKGYKAELEEREKSYKNYIEEKENVIQVERKHELELLNKIYVNLENSVSEVSFFGKRLFERNVNDIDFLKVYLGKGTIEAFNQIKFSKQEFIDSEDPISLLPEQISNKYKYINNAPVTSDFNGSNAVGVTGGKEKILNLLKNFTLDIAIRHSYKDVKFVYIFDNEYVNSFKWVRWLHNVENKQIDARNIVCDDESKNAILESIYAILSKRQSLLNERQTSIIFNEKYVVFVLNSSIITTHPLSKYLDNCANLGFTFVFFDENEELLPSMCNEIIRLDDNNNGEILNSVDGERKLGFMYTTISDEEAEKIAIKLGAVYVDEVTLEGQLTKNITMFDLLGILSVDDLDLAHRWETAKVYKSMAAPIGVKAGNEIVSLNISDKGSGHGPHGLVAGTTGSGKSEILQTYILSLATLFHPYDVGFVIIDFKGGGMANQFADLPHLIGTITNIDGREINRSLLSIKAELVKRQEMFSKAGVNHINDYIKLFKDGKVSVPMPHLIIIVDEFAELKAEYPDFMKELISAARIGRTLGVHLILATQKPAGVVDAQIWSNSKFKLCLKVQTKEDSNEVLKSPLAAEIVEPGRAYFQVGNNEIFELIQSAYSGAAIPEDGNEQKKLSVYERNIWGKKTLVYTNEKKTEESEKITQLEAIVDYVKTFCSLNNITHLPGICLPSLRESISTDEMDYNINKFNNVVVPIGVYDDPEQQRQCEHYLNISKENSYIVGSSQSGKTTLLQTIAYGLIRMYSPSQINMYFVDCGSMVLKMFEQSKHVGGVVMSNDDEKCKNLFKMIHSTISDRKEILSGKGVGNFTSYIEAGYMDMPLIVVLIDNLAAFKEYFSDEFDQLNSLTREGIGVGISFIITSATSNAMNYRTQANFGEKIALNCIDSNEYGDLFGHCRCTPRENPGRGLLMLEKRVLEWQAAIYGNSSKEAERSYELKAFIDNRNKEFDCAAKKIPMVPEKLILSDMLSEAPMLFREKGMIPIGITFDDVEINRIDIKRNGSLALLGDNDARIIFMKSFLTILAKNIIFHNVEAIIIDDKQESLKSLSHFGFVKSYTNDVSDGIGYLCDANEKISLREDDSSEQSTFMVLINNADVIRQINSDKSMSKELANEIRKADDINIFFLISQIENIPVGFNSSDFLKALKEERNGIVFAPILDNKFYEMNARVKTDTSFDKSMGYYFNNGTYSKLKIIE